jgi:nucleobase:cation symporter-1, NCS1 family
MIPFFHIPGLWVGFISTAMGGIDISLFIGLPVSALLYWILTRSLDLKAEEALAASQADELEQPDNEVEDLAGHVVD